MPGDTASPPDAAVEAINVALSGPSGSAGDHDRERIIWRVLAAAYEAGWQIVPAEDYERLRAARDAAVKHAEWASSFNDEQVDRALDAESKLDAYRALADAARAHPGLPQEVVRALIACREADPR